MHADMGSLKVHGLFRRRVFAVGLPLPGLVRPMPSLAWASSIALGDIHVTVTCGSKGFFLVVEEELGAEVVAVVVVATAVETARLDVVTVVMVEGRAPVLPGTARGMTVFSSGLTKAWNPSVVPIGKSLVPEIPPIPSLVEDGNAGNAA